MGRRIWEEHEANGEKRMPAFHAGPYRVLSLKKFLPAEGRRKKHLVQVWTDPGGMRTLTVGSIRLKDPGRVRGTLGAGS